MASNPFSRAFPPAQGRSFFGESSRRDDDVESRAALLDEENLRHQFNDYDLEHAEGLEVDDSRPSLGGAASPPPSRPRRGPTHRPTRASTSKSTWAPHDDDGDNDVPPSLLVEAHDGSSGRGPGQPRKVSRGHQGTAIPGPSTPRAHWDAAHTPPRQRANNPPASHHHGISLPTSLFSGSISGSAKKRAEWRWANVTNLDLFIKDVYDYYLGHGIWCILTDRFLHLVNVAFVAVLLTFLTQCVDYSKVRGSQKLSQILVPQCTRNMSGLWNTGLFMFAFYFIWKLIQYLLDMRRLLHVRDFYIYLLNIPDDDMQTITWQEVVARIMALRDQNPKTATNLTPEQRQWLGSQSKERLDASDIANRLMRRENYMIALFNKDILDLTIPLPFLRKRQLLSRTLEWMINFAILDFVFDERGQVNPVFLRSERRHELSMKLRRRFAFSGILILVLSPFIAGYLVVVYFLMYYHEVQKNPSVLSSRTYTPLAEWKFREFNELPHLFRERLNMSHPYAIHYIDQFPKAKTEMVARTVAFVSGALATVLAICSVIDPDLFLGFEITHDRTVLFYTAVFGSVWAFARGMISEDHLVFNPELAMRNVIQYTHYNPDHWEGRLHSADIKAEFSELYKMKVIIFIEEILSILTTPFVLLSSLPKCSDQIIDFFREFTIHVDGLGYVCSFAEFDFKNGFGKKKAKEGTGDVRDDYYSTKHGKMEASYYGFLGNYGNFVLDPKKGTGSHFPHGSRFFHPPPVWPGINEPDLQTSRMGRSRMLPRTGTGLHQPSPMASILLDPHHQPPAGTNFGARARSQQPQQQRGAGHQRESNIMEEPDEEDNDEDKRQDDEEAFEGGVALDESAWQTSPARTLNREDTAMSAPHAGVVHMIYQFNQAQLNRRPGGVR